MYISSSEEETSSKTSNSIYNTDKKEKTTWNINQIPLSYTWKDKNDALDKKYPDVDKSKLPDYETDLVDCPDTKLSKLLRRVARKDFTPITIESISDLDKVVGTCGNKPVSLKHSHLIAWDYEIATSGKRAGKVGYRTKRLLKGSDVLMADCDNTIPFDVFRKKFIKYRWFSRTSYGNINGDEKFHIFFLLDDYQNSDALLELTSKLSTLTNDADKPIFDAAPFAFGSMLAGHYREDIKVVWNNGECITNLCKDIVLKEGEKLKKIKVRKVGSKDTSAIDEGKYKRRVELAKKYGFLVSTSPDSSCLAAKNEKSVGGYWIYPDSPDFVHYFGSRPDVGRWTLWDKWLEDNDYSCIEPYYDLSKLIPLEDCEKKLDELMKSQSDGNHSYRVSAGVGKTTSAIKNLVYKEKSRNLNGDITRERCVILVPTHKLAEQMSRDVLEVHPYAEVQIITGRTNKDKVMCLRGFHNPKFQDLMNQVGGEGLGTFSTFCKNKKQECSYYKQCPYIQQYGNPDAPRNIDVVIMTHEHLSIPPVELLHKHLGEFDRLIIDEGFHSTLLFKKDIERTLVKKYIKSIAGFEEKRLLLAIDECKPDLEGKTIPILKNIREKGIDLDRALEECKSKSYKKQVNPVSTTEDIEIELARFRNTNIHLEEIIEALKKEIEYKRVESTAITIDDEHLYLHSKKPINDKFKNLPITYLDASSPSPDFIKTLTGIEFNHHEILCEDKADYYYENQTYPKRDVIPNKKYDTDNTANLKKKKMEDMRKVASNLTGKLFGKPDNTYNVLLCSYKEYLEDYIKDIPGNVVQVYFHQGLRGVNALQKCDVAYIVGRQEPSASTIEQDARCVYSDSPQSLDFIGNQRYTKEVRGMETIDGKVVKVLTSIHPDIRIHQMLEMVREEETIQILARLRSVRLAGKKIIFSGKVVLPVRITAEVNRNQMQHTGFVEMLSKLDNNDVLPITPDTILKMKSKTFDGLTYTQQTIKDELVRLRKYLNQFVDKSKDIRGQLPNILHKHLGLGIYSYKTEKKQKKGKILLSYSKDISNIISKLKKIYSVSESQISVECISPPVETEFEIHKKQRDFKKTISLYREWLKKEIDKEKEYISLYGDDGYHEDYAEP